MASFPAVLLDLADCEYGWSKEKVYVKTGKTSRDGLIRKEQ
jgi:hypothetical protein